MTLEQANQIIGAAILKGGELGLRPLSVAVLDAGGHLLAFQRQDGASTLRPQLAIGKASGALGLGISSRGIAEMAAERPGFVGSLGAIAPHGMVPAAGGLIIVDGEQRPIGAVGVTGDSSDNDEACAAAAISAVGLMAQRA
ncbi:heme-binding protein [Phenylobacterium sp.]|uniref:GlcG/HbpS family heme-binding protein n=1 Tax=Phenylobacterium sp. TaxID=1871053 RepID=UPI0025CD77EF|nr:heme-binding protein [Phenylobacterium sp.]